MAVKSEAGVLQRGANQLDLLMHREMLVTRQWPDDIAKDVAY